jgi:hypothetical protein
MDSTVPYEDASLHNTSKHWVPIFEEGEQVVHKVLEFLVEHPSLLADP